ncbi:gustatory receptor 23a-like [Contarinia nasturtii]|uniref:gustatory receptor 23a-like n=1 Tax=Contarinia nasturtii TaxID=265458 RepID=UPI0012D398EF|nr:gustatory receptor 23a-like [Contarinia nasturtii]
MLLSILFVVIELASCESCTKEVNLLAFLVTSLELNGEYANIFDLLLENFSLQLMHEPIVFSVAGVFRLNFTLLRAMVAGITTYMVIFIQFMPKLSYKFY